MSKDEQKRLQDLWDSMDDKYDAKICETIVKEAGLEDKWTFANSENFELVLEEAIEILGLDW